MLEVTFSPQEFEHAAFGGFARRRDCILRGAEQRWGYNPTAAKAWGTDIEAAIAEAAVAFVRDMFWLTGSIGAPDVGDNIQVRSCDTVTGHLLLHDSDPDKAPFYLVTNPDPNGMKRRVIGWLYGWEGKNKKKYWKEKVEGRPCYWVPQEALTRIRIRGAPQKQHDLFERLRV